MKITSLIDGDIVAYRCAASCWNAKTGAILTPVKIAYYRIEDMLDNIFKASASDKYRMFLSDSKNFRHEIYPQYKANRTGLARPPYLDNCKNYLVQKRNAEVCEGIEADDALGIAQCENPSTVICSIDKDLLQIPGLHYNFVKDTKVLVTPVGGLRHFFKQLLIGDVADNIHGIRGIGVTKANKLIDPLDSVEEMFECVRAMYKDDVRLLMNCDVLWIQQSPNTLFSQEYFQMLKDFNLHETIEC